MEKHLVEKNNTKYAVIKGTPKSGGKTYTGVFPIKVDNGLDTVSLESNVFVEVLQYNTDKQLIEQKINDNTNDIVALKGVDITQQGLIDTNSSDIAIIKGEQNVQDNNITQTGNALQSFIDYYINNRPNTFKGIWTPTTTYQINNMVASNGTPQRFFLSKIDNNLNNPLPNSATSNTNWLFLSELSVAIDLSNYVDKQFLQNELTKYVLMSYLTTNYYDKPIIDNFITTLNLNINSKQEKMTGGKDIEITDNNVINYTGTSGNIIFYEGESKMFKTKALARNFINKYNLIENTDFEYSANGNYIVIGENGDNGGNSLLDQQHLPKINLGLYGNNYGTPFYDYYTTKYYKGRAVAYPDSENGWSTDNFVTDAMTQAGVTLSKREIGVKLNTYTDQLEFKPKYSEFCILVFLREVVK